MSFGKACRREAAWPGELSKHLTRSFGSARKEMPKSENDGSLIFPHHLQRETKARLERKEVGVGEAASLAREEVYSGKALQREHVVASPVTESLYPLPRTAGQPCL